MSIQISNSGSTIQITQNGGSWYIPKPYSVQFLPAVTQPSGASSLGTITIKYSQGDENRDFSFKYADVTDPTTANVQALVDTIEAFQDSGIGESVTIVGPLGQQNDASSVSVVLSSGTQNVTSVNVTSSGTFNAGACSVKFTTSSDFVGKINGYARQANRAITFSADPGKTLAEITYEIGAGSMTIDSIL